MLSISCIRLAELRQAELSEERVKIGLNKIWSVKIYSKKSRV
jgi:hypothetical protein